MSLKTIMQDDFDDIGAAVDFPATVTIMRPTTTYTRGVASQSFTTSTVTIIHIQPLYQQSFKLGMNTERTDKGLVLGADTIGYTAYNELIAEADKVVTADSTTYKVVGLDQYPGYKYLYLKYMQQGM